MAVTKVILYYLFVPVADPESVKFWQRALCQRLGLRGRIIVSEHGINGTLGHELGALKAYVRELHSHSLFADTEIKWSVGKGDEFPRLSVRVRPELVTLAPEEPFDVFNAGVGLRPAEWHALLSERPDITLLDARNDYESAIGAFRGAITPQISAFRQIKQTIDSLDPATPVATYCTGDVRCEYLSAYMKHRGFAEVYHLDGGIVKYGEEFRDGGLWDGKCFVFDRRKHVAFSAESVDIGACSYCTGSTSTVVSCRRDTCPGQLVACEPCLAYEPGLCRACVDAP